MRTLRLLAASVRDLGVRGTLDLVPGYVLSPMTMRRLKRRKMEELSQDGFDAAHGTDTSEVLVGRELGPVVTKGGHLVVHYETTSEDAIRMPLDGLGVDFSEFVFVDLGCGKGKPLMVAASYPFRRLIGVDISSVCIGAARRNIARYGPEKIDPSRVELLVQDAEEFAFPDEPLVVYLYNPFPGSVLERVVARLEASLKERPRRAFVIYVNPHELAALKRSRSFKRVPTIADRMPMAAGRAPAHERAAVFVSAPSPPCRRAVKPRAPSSRAARRPPCAPSSTEGHPVGPSSVPPSLVDWFWRTCGEKGLMTVVHATRPWWDRLTPRVGVRLQLVAAAALWLVGTSFLLVRGVLFVETPEPGFRLSSWLVPIAAPGVAIGTMKARFILAGYARRAVTRIRARGRSCFFGFFAPTSWLFIAVMMGGGIMLRRSALVGVGWGRVLLAVLYIAVGTGLAVADAIFWKAVVRPQPPLPADPPEE